MSIRYRGSIPRDHDISLIVLMPKENAKCHNIHWAHTSIGVRPVPATRMQDGKIYIKIRLKYERGAR